MSANHIHPIRFNHIQADLTRYRVSSCRLRQVQTQYDALGTLCADLLWRSQEIIIRLLAVANNIDLVHHVETIDNIDWMLETIRKSLTSLKIMRFPWKMTFSSWFCLYINSALKYYISRKILTFHAAVFSMLPACQTPNFHNFVENHKIILWDEIFFMIWPLDHQNNLNLKF